MDLPLNTPHWRLHWNYSNSSLCSLVQSWGVKQIMDGGDMTSETKCPVHGGGNAPKPRGASNRDWWPNQLDLSVLHQHSTKSDPMGGAFKYA